MSLADAVIGLKAYKEVDRRTAQLWQDMGKAIFFPRMDITQDTLPSIHVDGVSDDRVFSAAQAYHPY